MEHAVSPRGLRADAGEARRRGAEEYDDVRKHLVDGLATTAVALTLVAALAVSPGWVAAADEGSSGRPPEPRRRPRRPGCGRRQGRRGRRPSRPGWPPPSGRLRDTAVRVAQAEEAFNRARWNYREARRDQRAAERSPRDDRDPAGRHARRVRRRRGVVVRDVALAHRHGRDPAGRRHQPPSSTAPPRCRTRRRAMDQVYDDYDAAALLAGVSSDQADRGPGRRRRAARGDQAGPRRRAGRPSGPPPARPMPSPAERVDLIGELARLQGISVALAEERQERSRRRPPRPPTPTPTPDADAHRRTHEPTPHPGADAGADAGPDDRRRRRLRRRPRRRPPRRADPDAHPDADADPDAHARPRRRPTPTPTPPPPPPPPAGGAAAAIAFARGPDRRALPVGRRRARTSGTARA